MANELDMEAYHQEGIEPGEHKVFSLAPTIHTFDERFSGMPSRMPLEAPGETFEGTPSLYRPSLKDAPPWPGENFPGPGFEHIPLTPENMGKYTPVSDKENVLPMQKELHPYLKALRDAGVEGLENLSEGVKNQLVDIIKDPTTAIPEMIMTGGLVGMLNPRSLGPKVSAFGRTSRSIWAHPENINRLLKYRDSGMTYDEIAKELGTTRNAVAGKLNTLKGYNWDVRRDRASGAEVASGKTEPYSPPIVGEKGDPEYEKALEQFLSK